MGAREELRNNIKEKEREVSQLLQRARRRSDSGLLRQLNSAVKQLITLEHKFSDSIEEQLQDIAAQAYDEYLDKESNTYFVDRLVTEYQHKIGLDKINQAGERGFALIDPQADQKLLERSYIFEKKVARFIKNCPNQYIAELSKTRDMGEVVIGSPLELEAIVKILGCRVTLTITPTSSNNDVSKIPMDLSFGNKASEFTIDLTLLASGTSNARYVLVAVDGHQLNIDLEQNETAAADRNETKSLFHVCWQAKKIHELNIKRTILNKSFQSFKDFISKISKNARVDSPALLKQEVVETLRKYKRPQISKWFERLIISYIPALSMFDAVAERMIIAEAIELQQERTNLMAETRVMTNIIMRQLQNQLMLWNSSSRASMASSNVIAEPIASDPSYSQFDQNYIALMNCTSQLKTFIRIYCETIGTTIMSNKREFLAALTFQGFAAFAEIANQYWSNSDEHANDILAGTARGAAFIQTLFTIFTAAFEETRHHNEIVYKHEKFFESLPLSMIDWIAFDIKDGKGKKYKIPKDTSNDVVANNARRELLEYWRYSVSASFYLKRKIPKEQDSKEIQLNESGQNDNTEPLMFVLNKPPLTYPGNWIVTNNSRYFLLLMLSLLQVLFTLLSLINNKVADASKGFSISNAVLTVIYEFILLYATIGGVSRLIDKELLAASNTLVRSYNRAQDLPTEILAMIRQFGISDDVVFTLSKLVNSETLRAQLHNSTHQLIRELVEMDLDAKPHIQKKLKEILHPFIQLLKLLEDKEQIQSALNGNDNAIKALLESVPRLMQGLDKLVLNLNSYGFLSDKDKHRIDATHNFGHLVSMIFDKIGDQNSKTEVDIAFKKNVISIPLDGNCLFNAVFCGVKALKLDDRNHIIHSIGNGGELREKIVEFMKNNIHGNNRLLELINTEVDADPDGSEEEFELYLQDMLKDGVWGGEVELYALQIFLGINFRIFAVNVYGNRTDRPPYDIGGHIIEAAPNTHDNIVCLTYNNSHYQVILDSEQYNNFLLWRASPDAHKIT